MGSNLLVGLLIVFLCTGLAVIALGCAICGVWLLRRKRGLGLTLLLPSAAYLALFLYFFIPRPLPHHVVNIDLRARTNLYGIPSEIKWMADSWPAPKTVVPLAPSGSFICVEGKVDFSIVLPDGNTIRDTARQFYVHTDDAGIWKIIVDVDHADPETALSRLESNLRPLSIASQSRDGSTEDASSLKERLSAFVSKSPSGKPIYYDFPTYECYLSLGPQFGSSSKVSYFYVFYLPHLPKYFGFATLPAVDHPQNLVDDCRKFLSSESASTIPKERWPGSVARLNPSQLRVENGNVFLVFQSFGPLGSHCYAISSAAALEKSDQIRVLSSPFPGISEVHLAHPVFR